MSGKRQVGLLLRLYPPAWRARYGDELAALILESSTGRRLAWRVRADVALAGGRERLRSAGLAGDGLPPGERVRGGSLLVLCAWVLFVVAGGAVQKVSEHWQDVTPSGSRAVPSAAFQTLVAAAGIGTVLVLAGIAATLPALAAFLRDGGWPEIRRRIAAATLLTALTAAGMVPLAIWAHHLDVLQRNGHDLAYGVAISAWGLVFVACLVAWSAAAVATARRLTLTASLLRLEAWVGSAVTAAMGVMTAATAIWWAAVAHSAPWFLSGRPIGSPASPLAPPLLVAAILMLVATGLGTLGAARALRALPALGSDPRA